jgi:hypothetical protein
MMTVGSFFGFFLFVPATKISKVFVDINTHMMFEVLQNKKDRCLERSKKLVCPDHGEHVSKEAPPLVDGGLLCHLSCHHAHRPSTSLYGIRKAFTHV